MDLKVISEFCESGLGAKVPCFREGRREYYGKRFPENKAAILVKNQSRSRTLLADPHHVFGDLVFFKPLWVPVSPLLFVYALGCLVSVFVVGVG